MRSIISLVLRSLSDFEIFSPVTRKVDFRGFDHLGHNPCCTVTVDDYRVLNSCMHEKLGCICS